MDTDSTQSSARERVIRPASFVPIEAADIEQSIAARLETQVRLYPQHIAIRDADETLTYDAFNRAANRLAHAILAVRGEGSEPVALLCTGASRTVIALMAVLKSGKFYAPLDPAYPEAWLTAMCRDMQPGLMLCDDAQQPLAARLTAGHCPILNLSALAPSLSDANPGLRIAPDVPACLTYTSGATGTPKSLLNNQRNILQTLWYETNRTYLGPADRAALLSSVSHANSRSTIFNALLNGSTLCPFDVKQQGAAALVRWMHDLEITTYKSVSSLFRNFVEQLEPDETFPHMRVAVLGGEPISKRDIDLFRSRFASRCALRISYGASETTGIGIAVLDRYDLSGDCFPLALDAVPGKQVMVWDERDREVGANEVGEIVVRSVYLANGYWRKPELTQAVFLPDPAGSAARIYRTGDLGRRRADGRFEILERKDAQIKIRGFRVEPGQIEAALLELDGIQEAVTLLRGDAGGTQLLVAYYVERAGTAHSPSDLRAHVRQRLPDYMVPAHFVRLAALPVAPGGKLDRNALPSPPMTRPELATPFVAPRTVVEQTLAAIWKGVLALDEIGIYDPFLDLGGDSLRASRIVARVLRLFAVALPASALYDCATVALMAEKIARQQTAALDHGDITRALDALEKMSDEEANWLLARA